MVGLISKGICIHLRLVLGSHTMSRSPHCPAKILKVLTEALMRFSHMFSLGGLNDSLLSQGSVLGTPSGVGKAGRMLAPRTREGARLPGSSWRVHQQLRPCDDLLQHQFTPMVTCCKNCSMVPHSGYWHMYSRDIKYFHNHEDLSGCRFIDTPTSLLLPDPHQQLLICSVSIIS